MGLPLRWSIARTASGASETPSSPPKQPSPSESSTKG